LERIAIGEFTWADALASLLTTESLLFAAFTLAVNLSAPTPRVRRWLVPGRVLVAIAVVALTCVAFGAATAWFEIFVVGGFPRRFAERVIAGAVIAAIVIQPALAALLALGLRRPQAP
jgi:uncharacterized membrane protein